MSYELFDPINQESHSIHTWDGIIMSGISDKHKYIGFHKYSPEVLKQYLVDLCDSNNAIIKSNVSYMSLPTETPTLISLDDYKSMQKGNIYELKKSETVSGLPIKLAYNATEMNPNLELRNDAMLIHFLTVLNAFTKPQREAIRLYTMGAYMINLYLRKNMPIGEFVRFYNNDAKQHYFRNKQKNPKHKEGLHLISNTDVHYVKKLINNLDEVFVNNAERLPKRFHVYRGTNQDDPLKPFQGYEHGYLSTSTFIEPALRFSGNCIYVYIIEPGTPFIAVEKLTKTPNQYEILLPRGIQIKCFKTIESKNKIFHHCTVSSSDSTIINLHNMTSNTVKIPKSLHERKKCFKYDLMVIDNVEPVVGGKRGHSRSEHKQTKRLKPSGLSSRSLSSSRSHTRSRRSRNSNISYESMRRISGSINEQSLSINNSSEKLYHPEPLYRARWASKS